MTLRRATGEVAFAADFTRPGALHLAIRRSPLAHGRVRSARSVDARALPGVAAVLTAEDADGLLEPVVRFVGDRLAVVAAEDPEIARRGAEMLHVELEPLPAVLDPEAALDDPAHVVARLDARTGDVDEAFAAAEQVVEGTWTFPLVPAIALEPPVALTWLDEDHRLVVRTSADSPFRVRRVLADRLGLPAARIRVVRPVVAGGAEGRSDVPVEDLCALVTLRTGRPARLALTAAEELTLAPGHPPQRVRLRLAMKGGLVSGLDLRLLVDVGAEADNADGLLRSAGRQALALYGARALRLEAVAVRTHRPPTSTPRGADDAAAFAVECAVSEATAGRGDDAIAKRGALLRTPGAGHEALAELDEAPGAHDARPVGDVLRVAVEQAEWRRKGRSRVAMDALRPGRGFGLARRSAGVAGGTGSAASLRLLEDGSLTLAAGPSSAGGADETLAAAAAAILGVPTRRVVLAAADTDSAPFESGDSAAGFLSAGRAVEEAAEQVRDRIRQAGASLLGVDAERVEVVAGEVREPGGGKVSFAEIGTSALEAGQPLEATAAPAAGSAPPSDAAVVARVEVDVETGVVRPLGLTAVVAGGPFDDPRPAEAQVEGALAAALERALAAGLSFDADGRPLAPALRSWPLVGAGDVPPVSVTFVSVGEHSTRFGAVAVGEAAGRAAVAALARAIADATGGTVRSLPLGPAAVLDLVSGA